MTEYLARGILQTGHIIQIVVIELVEEGGPGVINHRIVDEPTRLFIYRAFDHDLNPKTMSMQSLAFVSFRHVRQSVGGLKAQLSDESHVHNEQAVS